MRGDNAAAGLYYYCNTALLRLKLPRKGSYSRELEKADGDEV
jgi:hypothetical protein